MRTCVLVAGDFTRWGGMDRANYELAWHLAEHEGARVELVAHSVAPPLAHHANVVWHRVRRPLDRHVLAEPLLALAGRRVASRATGALAVSNGGNLAWPGVNWVHAVHAAWENRDEHAGAFFRAKNALAKRSSRRSERRALRAARLVLTNSQRAREQVVAGVGIASDRVRTVYYGNDSSTYRPHTPEERLAARRRLCLNHDRPVAAFVGALGRDRNKGFDVLFDAWSSLCGSTSWDADLLVAGGGAEVDLWRRRASALDIGGRVRFLGFTRQVPDVLAAADLLVGPTHYEAYGLAVHEALCCGVPALVTKTAGVAERIDLSELLLDAPPSARDLVGRLRRWRADPTGLRERVAPLGARLRERTWTDMAREILHLAESTRASGVAA